MNSYQLFSDQREVLSCSATLLTKLSGNVRYKRLGRPQATRTPETDTAHFALLLLKQLRNRSLRSWGFPALKEVSRFVAGYANAHRATSPLEFFQFTVISVFVSGFEKYTADCSQFFHGFTVYCHLLTVHYLTNSVLLRTAGLKFVLYSAY